MILRKFGSGTLIAISIIGMMLVVTTAGLLSTNQTLSTAGSITPISAVGVTIYSDSALTTPMSSISWGSITPGGQTSATIYIKNTGNIPETLTMNPTSCTTKNANTYMT
jgi:hypothetical protein